MADISRSEVSTIIQEEYGSVLLDAAVSNSAALQAFRTVDMGTKTQNLPVLATIPEAEFVTETGEGSTKPTAQATWGNKQLVAEEIAVIVPVHENVVDDATEDILDEITRQGGAAIGRKLDGAVLFGTDKPVSWTSDSLFEAADDASQTVTVGDVEDGEDIGGGILIAAGLVDESGWDPTALLAPRGLRFRIANMRDANGATIFTPAMRDADGSFDDFAGLQARWVSGRVWDRDEAEALVVDAERVIIGVRQDVTVKLLTEATLTDGEGTLNLAERDMIALRFKARYAYVLGNTLNDEGNTQVPVAAVTPAVTSS